MMDAYLGTIVLWALNYAPDGWAFCNGQLLSVNNYQAMYSLLGNMYGGTPNVNFALPDLRCRIPLGAGQVTGLTTVNLAAKGGDEDAKLIQHTHSSSFNNISISVQGNMMVSSKPATLEAPISGSSIAATMTTDGSVNPTVLPALGFNNENPDVLINGLNIISSASANNLNIDPAGTATIGTYANMQPFLALNYIICLQGYYPTRP